MGQLSLIQTMLAVDSQVDPLTGFCSPGTQAAGSQLPPSRSGIGEQRGPSSHRAPGLALHQDPDKLTTPPGLMGPIPEVGGGGSGTIKKHF